jgi:hypothetical protein
MAESHRNPEAGLASPYDIPDSSPSEHIYIGTEDSNPNPARDARTVVDKFALRNSLRDTLTEVTLFAEGFAKIRQYRRGKKTDSFDLDLHYLDPVPSIERVLATRWWYAVLGAGGTLLATWALAQFQTLRPFALPAMLLAGAAMLVAGAIALHRSHERIKFATIHGRAPVLTLIANVGSMRRFHAFVPILSRAIEEAAEQIGADTSAYLRGEMREHYRLRGAGVLTHESCAVSTGRILAHFDVQL